MSKRKQSSRLVVQLESVFGWEDFCRFTDDFKGLTDARIHVKNCRKELKERVRLVRFTAQVLPVKA